MISKSLHVTLFIFISTNVILARNLRQGRSVLLPYPPPTEITTQRAEEKTGPYPPPVEFSVNTLEAKPEKTEEEEPYPAALPVKPSAVPKIAKATSEENLKPYAPAVPVLPIVSEYHYTIEPPKITKPYTPAVEITTTTSKPYPPVIVKEEISGPYAAALPVMKELPATPIVPIVFQYNYTLETPKVTNPAELPESKPYPSAAPVTTSALVILKEKSKPYPPAISVIEEPTAPVVVSEYQFSFENPKPYAPAVESRTTTSKPYAPTVPPTTTTSKSYPPVIVKEEISGPYPAALPAVEEEPASPIVFQYNYTLETPKVTKSAELPESKPYPSAASVTPSAAVVAKEISKPYAPTISVIEELKAPAVVFSEYHYSFENAKPYAPAVKDSKPYAAATTAANPYSPLIITEETLKPYPAIIPAVKEIQTVPVVPVVFKYNYTIQSPAASGIRAYPAVISTTALPTSTYPYPPAVPTKSINLEDSKPYPAAG